MPYKVRKVKCKNSKGKSGNYIITKKNNKKKISCHSSEEKANSAIRAIYANESLEKIKEAVILRLLKENKKFNGSHPEENYLNDWHKIEEKWFDLEGLTTWDEDRQTTKKYLKDMGML